MSAFIILTQEKQNKEEEEKLQEMQKLKSSYSSSGNAAMPFLGECEYTELWLNTNR